MTHTAFKVETTRTTHSGTPLYYFEEDYGFKSHAIAEAVESAEFYGLFIEPEKIEKTLEDKGYFKASRVRSFDVVFVEVTLVKY